MLALTCKCEFFIFSDRIFEVYLETYDEIGNLHLFQVLGRKRLNSYYRKKKILDIHYSIYEKRKFLTDFFE